MITLYKDLYLIIIYPVFIYPSIHLYPNT